jgi:hypothetical protein
METPAEASVEQTETPLNPQQTHREFRKEPSAAASKNPDRSSAEKEELARAGYAIDAYKDSQGFITTKAENLMKAWGLYDAGHNGLGDLEEWVEKAYPGTLNGNRVNMRVKGGMLEMEVENGRQATRFLIRNPQGDVQKESSYTLQSIGDLHPQNLEDPRHFIRDLLVNPAEHQELISSLRDLSQKGISLKDEFQSAQNCVAFMHKGNQIALCDHVLDDDWEARMLQTAREVLSSVATETAA